MTTAASPPAAAGCCPGSWWSYCSQIQRLSTGSASRAASAAPRHPSGALRSRAGSIVGCFGVGDQGRSYIGASSPSALSGRSVADLALVLDDEEPRVGRLPTTANRDPILEDRLGLLLAAGLQNHQHALLAFREHHLVGASCPLRGAERRRGRARCRARPWRAISTDEDVSPAAPMSWMPMTASVAMSSRHASISSFSGKGSPTCTVGRFSSDSRRTRRSHRRAMDAVAASLGATIEDGFPTPAAAASRRSSPALRKPDRMALTRMLPL